MKKLSIVSILFFASLAFAGPGGNPMPFGEFDANNNGVITEEEFNTAQANHMAKMAEENRPMRNAGNAPQFSDLDLNGDGEVTQEELRKSQEQHREKMMQERGPKGKGNGPRGMM